MTALEEIKKAEHERIWLEPAGAPDRCWCQDNQWGEEGVEYVLASTLERLQRENDKLALANAILSGNFEEACSKIKYLQAEIDRKSSMPGDHRYWEGRYRDEAVENDRLNAILEPFRAVSKDWVDENGWTDVACQKDRIVDWFGPSDFRALASTGGEHHAE